jgi:TrmH family RNA methyltransferase
LNTITSRHNPVVARFRAAASRRDNPDDILLDGVHLIQEAFAAGLTVTCVAVTATAGALATLRTLLDGAASPRPQVYQVSAAVMEALSPVRSPSGAVALARPPRHTLAEAVGRAPQLVVAGVDVQDPGNVGAIARAAEAGGATGVVLAGASADPFGWKALRGSMGSAFRLPVVTAPLDRVVDEARRQGLRVVATVPRGGEPMTVVDLARPLLLLLGGEGPGLPDAVVESADTRVTIPMRPPVESLNVSVAAAVLVYEAARQRRLFAAH